jgi:hypothetical protein
MASTAVFAIEEIKSDIELVKNCIHTSLGVLFENNAKNIGFDHNNTPIFELSTPEDEHVYANLLKAVELLCQIWYTGVGNHIHLRWVQKIVFDTAGRPTDRTRLCFEMVSTLPN